MKTFSGRWLTFITLLLWMLAVAAPIRAGDPPAYLNPDLLVEQRVDDLLVRMTTAEKIGQMTLVEKDGISPTMVTTFAVGGVLSGGDGLPSVNTPVDWAMMVDGFQSGALQTRLAIPILYGIDAVHGHNAVFGATIFPHEVALGAANDPQLVEQIARATAEEMIATGIYWTFAPMVAVPQDIRWGRAYEAYGENTELVSALGVASLRGLQTDRLSDVGAVLATPKHYVGDGGAVWGTSPFGPSNIDEGITHVDEATLRAIHLPPYVAAIDAGAQSIMVSFTSWGGMFMHAQRYLVTDVLKGELGFSGFVVSDWQGIDRISPSYYQAVVASINAGLDMIMVPSDFPTFMGTLMAAVDAGDVSMERIDDAVRRILRVKFELGLFEHPMSDASLLNTVGSREHRALARQAVSESLVLLKNAGATLPLDVDTPTILIGGSAADDIGVQSGGWTLGWQGSSGEITPGTTIRRAVEGAVADRVSVHYSADGVFPDMTELADVGIAVVGEQPYAEWFGDSPLLSLSAGDINTIRQLRAASRKLVVVLISGRPLVIDRVLNTADAVVAAWLPGTQGQGVADGLFGVTPFTGRLPYTWLRSADQLPFDFDQLPTEGCDAPLFPYGYGLDAEHVESPYLDLAETCSAALPAL